MLGVVIGEAFAHESEHGKMIGRLEVEEVRPPINPYTRSELEQLRGQRLDGTRVPTGRSLARWLRDEGWTFELTGPDGRLHDVSLEEWRGCDVESTHVAVRFHSVPLDRYEREIAAR